MPQHRQDSAQPQQSAGFPCVEGPEMTWTNIEELYQQLKYTDKGVNPYQVLNKFIIQRLKK